MFQIKSILERERDKDNVVKWNFIFYILTFIYTILIGVVLVPLYLKYITAETYGYWLATGNILTLLTVVDPGFSAVIQQKIAFNYGKNDKIKVGEYTGIGLFIGLSFSLLVFFLGIICYTYFSSIIVNIEYSPFYSDIRSAFGLSLIGTILMLIYYIWGAVDYAILSSKGIGFINIIGNLTSLVSIIFFLLNDYGIIALGLGSLLRGLTFLLLSIIYTLIRFNLEKIKISFNRKILPEFISLMGFNFLGKIGLNITSQLNSFISANFINPVAATTLKFTQTVPEFSKVIVVRIANSVAPVVPNLVAENKDVYLKQLLLKVFYYSLWIVGLIFVGFYILNESFISLWVGKEFYGGTLINQLVLSLLLLSVLSELLSIITFSLGNIKKNSIVFFIQGCIYVPLAIFLSQRFGISGILIAGIVSHLVTTFWYYPLSISRLLKFTKKEIICILIELIKIVFINGIIILLFNVLFTNSITTWINFILYALLIVFIYLLLLFFASKEIRIMLYSMINKIK